MKCKIEQNKTLQRLIEAYGENCMFFAHVFELFKIFSSKGHENVEDDEHLGPPFTSRTEENVENIS